MYCRKSVCVFAGFWAEIGKPGIMGMNFIEARFSFIAMGMKFTYVKLAATAIWAIAIAINFIAIAVAMSFTYVTGPLHV
ncbi:hypothetical protein GCM10011379_28840 [Filimonas zeae]|uniref:Uncharacterized protein n=1 Tax=Filimonas zeae TaxID=1737353 RepID=A0A917MWS5_9BACT|nr:hypothetical protein GCM10011379_28840 [Filimonas zeae]